MTNQKSKLATILLCFFFGVLGIHRFYTGYFWIGLIYFFSGGFFGIGIIIDFIFILFGFYTDSDGRYLS